MNVPYDRHTVKKTTLLMGLVAVSAIAGGSFAYGWHRVTGLPSDEYSEHNQANAVRPRLDEPISNLSQLGLDQPGVTMPSKPAFNQVLLGQTRAATHEDGKIHITLDEQQLTQLINNAILNQPQAAQVLANAKSLQTTLSRDRIETGAILNLAELPRESLSVEIQAGLEQLASVAPVLTNRDIYVGIVAQPQVQDGKLSLDQDLGLQLGQFTLPLDDMSDQLGFSTSVIEQHLNAALLNQGLTLETLEILDQQLILTGTKP